jgi:imidazolonepropionase
LLTLRGTRGPRRGLELSELGVIPDGGLLIRDGILVEVGPSRRVENLAEARGAMEINAAGRVVMPGFIDSHTHLVFPPPGSAGAEEESATARVCSTSGQRLEGRARGILEAMARHGTTMVEAKSGCGMDESAEIKVLRVLSAFERDPVEVIPTFLLRVPEDGGEAQIEWVLGELLPKIRRRKLAQFADLAWSDHAPLRGGFAPYLTGARQMGFRCKIHADGEAPAAIVAALDHLVVSLDHLERATQSDAAQLAGAPTIATLLPAAAARSGGPFPPARDLVECGAAVALASNFNAHHTPMLSMQTVIALACREMGLTAEQAIAAATINGAHALARGAQTGSLEPGKAADAIMLEASDYRELASHLGTNLVQMTIKNGRIIYKQGEVGLHAAGSGGRPT